MYTSRQIHIISVSIKWKESMPSSSPPISQCKLKLPALSLPIITTSTIFTISHSLMSLAISSQSKIKAIFFHAHLSTRKIANLEPVSLLHRKSINLLKKLNIFIFISLSTTLYFRILQEHTAITQ